MRSLATALTALALMAQGALGNPEPDVPVEVTLDANGMCSITVEVDPRCFTEDPMRERYWMKADLTYQSKDVLLAMQAQARRAMLDWVSVALEPAAAAALVPDYQCTFVGQDGRPLEKADDPVVVRGRWTFHLPEGVSGIRLRANKAGRFSVVLSYRAESLPVRRATLFPGEESFLMQRPSAQSQQ